MEVWTGLDSYRPDPDRPLILALGNFDGVHVGHQEILGRIVERAKEVGGSAGVFTFWEHPQRVLHDSGKPALLTSIEQRLFLIQERGADICFLLHFTSAFSKTQATDFVEKWLIRKVGAKEIYLGYNAHFGYGREGDSQLMQEASGRLGFDFFEAAPVKVNGEFVSSSLVRKLVLEGELERVQRILDRPFSLFATVVRGGGMGKALGFPTANLKPHNEVLPPRGVYPVEVRTLQFTLRKSGQEGRLEFISGQQGPWHQGVLNYGLRPTFGPSASLVPEVFLFDFSSDIYGKTVEIVFHPRLRDERTFVGAPALVRAIEEDVARARKYFTQSFTRA